VKKRDAYIVVILGQCGTKYNMLSEKERRKWNKYGHFYWCVMNRCIPLTWTCSIHWKIQTRCWACTCPTVKLNATTYLFICSKVLFFFH